MHQPHERPLGAFKLIQTLRRNPLEIWTKKDFELPIQIRKTIVYTRILLNDAAAIKYVFVENQKNYQKNDLQLRLLRPALGQGILTSNGDDWRRQRQLLAPLFTPQHSRNFNFSIQQVANNAAEKLSKLPEGSQIEIEQFLGQLALEVLENTLFVQGLVEQKANFQTAITHYFETYGLIDWFDVLGVPQFVPRFHRWQGRNVIKLANQMVDTVIQQRMQLMQLGQTPPQDILTLLLSAVDNETGTKLSEQELKDNILTFIAAGHETTSNALIWTLYLLSQSPAWREQIEHEVDSRFDANNPVESLPTMMAFLEESMRLFPPVAMMSRVALQDDNVGGVAIKAGTIVTIAQYVLHRHKTLWQNPNAFMPERFMPANRGAIDKYSYLPFGVGNRVCIGAKFAMNEMAIILGVFLQKFRFDLVPNQIILPMVRITMRPKNGMKMLIRHR